MVDPGMGLPLSNTGMNAVSTTYAIKELVGCRAKRAKHWETKGQEVEAVTGTRLRVPVSLRLLNRSQCRGSIPLAPSGRGDADQVQIEAYLLSVLFIKITFPFRRIGGVCGFNHSYKLMIWMWGTLSYTLHLEKRAIPSVCWNPSLMRNFLVCILPSYRGPR